MMSSTTLLLVLVATAIHGCQGMEAAGGSLRRPTRQYSGYSNVGYRAGGRHHQGAAPAALIKPCIDIHEIANGQVVCRMSGCRLRCLEGFSFIETVTEQSSAVTLSCDHASGKLMFREMTWTPEMTMCSPLCGATCENGGTCVAPNKCACTGPYTGDTCSEEPMLGDQPYKGYQPASLGPNQRRVECEPGTRMPDGSTSVTLTFRDNSWFFPDGRLLLGVDQVTCEKASLTPKEKKPASDRPDSDLPTSDLPISDLPISDLPTSDLPISDLPTSDLPTSGLPKPDPLMAATSSPPIFCHPPCQNGGQCVYTNTCSCPRGFWGPSCQVNTCTYPRFQNMLNASLGGTLKKMKFECHPGYHTRQGHDRVVVICQNGLWKLPSSGRLLVEDDVKCIRD